MSKRIVLTAGHSYKDSGAVTTMDGVLYKESVISAKFRNALAKKLRDRGFEVITDGDGDENDTLNNAIGLIRKYNPALALEIHCNASSNPTAHGIETISLPKDKHISQEISMAVSRITQEKLRGDNGWIDQSQSARGKLGYVNAGGLILETFFISNHNSLRFWLDNYWLVATEVADTLESIL